MKFNTYKKFMKKKIKEAAFNFLDNSKKSQSKLHHQEYKSLTAQKFLKSGKFLNEEVYLLSKLKSRNTPVNFKGLHSDTLCSLGCSENESQQHLLECKHL